MEQLSRLPTRKTAEREYAEGLYDYEAREGDKKQLFSSFATQEKAWNYQMRKLGSIKRWWW